MAGFAAPRLVNGFDVVRVRGDRQGDHVGIVHARAWTCRARRAPLPAGDHGSAVADRVLRHRDALRRLVPVRPCSRRAGAGAWQGAVPIRRKRLRAIAGSATSLRRWR